MCIHHKPSIPQGPGHFGFAWGVIQEQVNFAVTKFQEKPWGVTFEIENIMNHDLNLHLVSNVPIFAYIR